MFAKRLPPACNTFFLSVFGFLTLFVQVEQRALDLLPLAVGSQAHVLFSLPHVLRPRACLPSHRRGKEPMNNAAPGQASLAATLFRQFLVILSHEGLECWSHIFY